MLVHLRHDWRRFLVGGLLPGQWALVMVFSAVWGTVLATASTRYRTQGIESLWRSAPYGEVMGFIVPLFLVINCGIRFGSDYKQGTLKYELLTGTDRALILSSRCVFLAASAGIAYFAAALGYGLVPILTGRALEVRVEAVGEFLASTGVVWAGSVPLLALLVLGGVSWRSMEVEVVLGVLLLVCFAVVNSVTDDAWWALPTAFMLRPLAAFTGLQAGVAAGVALVVSFLAAVIAFQTWGRKDFLR